ncbi:transcriptional repressor [Chryseobacterium fluminis]|uniref:Fur family transcriptional regulator n=1 Tax=Chryseobacterium fluminis TaxID=2983606 RepID=UPI00224FC42D|nr:transcriptional repressor [Chryseobacterium sp. MMS21-Ot14]UZT99195.1 transcriptional repressor [Chryseobacterium sp. MMS21-Ot14]
MKKTRNTQAKSEILSLLNDSDKALSHHMIQEKVGALCNRVTIYRVLERLEEEGLVHKFVNVDGVVNYAKCHGCKEGGHLHNHVHFNCRKCHQVTCIENSVPQIKMPPQFIIEDYNFVISGICPNCQ